MWRYPVEDDRGIPMSVSWAFRTILDMIEKELL
jgi:hypothetical protein